MFRVATFNQNQLAQSYALATQSRVSDAYLQISSGKKAQSYAPIARDAFALTSIEGGAAQAQQFMRNIDVASARLEIMDSSVGTLTERATSLLATLSSALSGSNMADIPLESFAAAFREEIAALLNARHEGRYLFSGSMSDRPAVDLSDPDWTPTAGLPGSFTADSGYYQGDSVKLAVRPDESYETVYGVTADEPAFEKLLRAVAYMDYAGANDDRQVLQQSYDLMREALEGLGDLRGRMGANAEILKTSKHNHETFLAYAENLASELEDVDLAAASQRLAADQTQLQASYLAFSRVNGLSLLDFLS